MGSEEKKIKVLLVAACSPGVIGGQATSARILLSRLDDRVDWTLVSIPPPREKKGKRMLDSFRVIGTSIYKCMNKRIRVAHIFTSCTRTALYEKMLLGLMLRISGVRTVLNFRGAFDEFYMQCSFIEKKLIQFFLRRQSVLLCQSEAIRLFLTREGIVADSKTSVIPNAVEAADAAGNRETRSGKIKILCLSWIVSSKGLDLLIDAAAEIHAELTRHHANIEIAGPEEEPGLKAKLRQQAERLGVKELISIAEPVSGNSKYDLLRTSSIFVFPSRKEGFPNALIEAMMSGLPVITTNKAPMNAIIQDGVSGLLFEKDNSSDLGKKILVLLRDESLRAALAAAGRNHAIENFAAEKVMPRFFELYKKMKD